jgi:hypothetical protein
LLLIKTRDMTQEKLQSLYDAIYEYTDVLGDTALDILDDEVDKYNAEYILDKFLNEAELTEAEAKRLAYVFEVAEEGCRDTVEELEY